MTTGMANPFTLMRRITEEMDRFFEGFGVGEFMEPFAGFEQPLRRGGVGALLRSSWNPQVEVFQQGDDLVVRADLPGMRMEDVNVQVYDDAIVLSGERRLESEQNREGVYVSERSYGSFQRMIPLPQGVDASQVEASFENGVLEVRARLPEQRRPRTVKVRGQGPETGGGAGSHVSSASGSESAGTGTRAGEGSSTGTARETGGAEGATGGTKSGTRSGAS